MKQIDKYRMITINSDKIEEYKENNFYLLKRAYPSQYDLNNTNELLSNRTLRNYYDEMDRRLEIADISLSSQYDFYVRNRLILTMMIGFSYGLEDEKYLPYYYASAFLDCAKKDEETTELGESSKKAGELLKEYFDERNINAIKALIDICEIENNVGKLEIEHKESIYRKHNVNPDDYSYIETFRQCINDANELSKPLLGSDIDFQNLETVPGRKLLNFALSIKPPEEPKQKKL